MCSTAECLHYQCLCETLLYISDLLIAIDVPSGKRSSRGSLAKFYILDTVNNINVITHPADSDVLLIVLVFNGKSAQIEPYSYRLGDQLTNRQNHCGWLN